MENVSRAWGLAAWVLMVACGCQTQAPSPASSGAGSGTGGDAGGVSELAGNITIDGSSTVFPFSEAAADQFKQTFPKINVTVAVSGTGGGFKRFSLGETDISNASRPIKGEEFEQCKAHQVSFLELPVAYDGLTIVVNPANDFVDQLTVAQLRQIFLEGGVSKWSDVKAGWPDKPIKIFAPGTDSGTFDYFKEVLVGKGAEAIRSDISVSEDDNVLVTGVSGETAAIGFFGAAYYFENKTRVKAVPIVNPETNEAVAPTAETIKGGTYAPFGRPLFIYVNVQSIRRPEMKKFVEFQLEHAPALATKVGYVPLPETVYAAAKDHVANRLAGTHYLQADGTKRDGPVEQIFQESNLLDTH